MPNPFRLTIRWLSADAFPRCRVVVPGDPPRWDFGLISDWYIPPVATSHDVADCLDRLRKGIGFAYTGDQLRVLAVQMRKTVVPLADPMAYPWNAEGVDPYGDPAYQFECEYSGKAGTGTLLLWVAEIRVEG